MEYASPGDALKELWNQQRYMEALTAAWQTPPVYGYHLLIPRGSEITLRDLILRSCQQALALASQDETAHAKTQTWVNTLLLQFPPPPALTDHSDGSEAETYRERIIRAHLECVRIALLTHEVEAPPLTAFVQAASSIDFPAGFLRDLTLTLLPSQVGGVSLIAFTKAVSLTGLLVGATRGVVATLTLELIENGAGTLYPSPSLAFVRRDAEFQKGEAAACTWSGLASRQCDVRWSLRRLDGQPIGVLTGPSLGAAFSLGLAKLLGSHEDIADVELEFIGATAAVDSTNTLRQIGGLWQKLGEQTIDLARRGLLQTVIVAAEQLDVPEGYLREEATPLRIIKARDLAQAVRLLNEQSITRRAVQQYEQEQGANIDVLGRIVPLENHYQLLPLLREVKREFLPNRSHIPDKGEDFYSELHQVDILRWEEELREELVTYERVGLVEIFQHFPLYAKEATNEIPRFVVLGPPGSGKTTLVQYLALQAASGSLTIAGRRFLPTRVRLREWEAWTTSIRGVEQRLPEYLAEHYKNLAAAPNAQQWRYWLQRGEVLLLLDGLDEIEGKPPFITAFKEGLLLFKSCPTVLTCRTVSFEQHRAVCPDFPLFTLAGLDRETRDAYIRTFPAEHPESYRPDALISQLNRNFQMLPLAANPLLLSIMCYVADNLRRASLPTTRGDLYKRAIVKLLTRRPRRVDIHYPGEEPDTDQKLAVLERAAFHLFAQGDRRLTFTGRELDQALKRALGEEGYGMAPTPWANALRADLTHNSGVLRGDADQETFFLHLTVQEFLVASAIAKRVNEQGWKALVEAADQQVNLWRLVDNKAWSPQWREVVTLLAGQLDNPVPLFQMLTDQKRDDLFRSRLALAVMCLPEVPPSFGASHAVLIDDITTRAFSCWFEHEKKGAGAAVPHFTRALPALGQVNGRMNRTSLLAWLCRQLGVTDRYSRSAAAEALGHIGEAAAYNQEVLATLQSVLQNSDAFLGTKAVEALRRMGAVAAQSAMVPLALVHAALFADDWFVRTGAVKALTEMGTQATQFPEVFTAFFTALNNDNPQVRSAAAGALGQLVFGETQKPHVHSALIAVLDDGDEGVRAEAATALERSKGTLELRLDVSPDSAPQALAGLTTHLQPRPASVLQEARESSSPELIGQAVVTLRNGTGEERREAAKLLGQMGAKVAQDHATLLALTQALYDEDAGLRSEAAWALGQFGEAAAPHAEVLPALVQIALHDRDGGVRSQATEALGQMRATIAQTPQVLDALIAVLRNKDPGVRAQAARALGQIGKALASHPAGITGLLAALRDEDSSVRFRAAEALGKVTAQGVRIFRRWWGKIASTDVEELTRL